MRFKSETEKHLDDFISNAPGDGSSPPPGNENRLKNNAHYFYDIWSWRREPPLEMKMNLKTLPTAHCRLLKWKEDTGDSNAKSHTDRR